MSQSEKQAKRSDLTKQKILVAAEQAFAEKGLYGARVDEISELAGINKRMIYAHFGSKENLYIAVLDEIYKELADSEQELLNQNLDSVELVKQCIENAFTYLYDNPTFVKMVLWENLNQAEYLKKTNAKAAKNAAFNLLRKVLKDGMKKGAFRAELDVDDLVLSTQMFCYSYYSNIHTMGYLMDADFFGRKQMEKRCKHITDMILRYIIKTDK